MSGVTINVLRIICLLIFGSSTNTAITLGTMVYFCCASFIVFLNIFIHMKFSSSKYFHHYMDKIKEKEINLDNDIVSPNTETKNLLVDGIKTDLISDSDMH